MQIKSKYRIARRVRAPIFEKTQSQKFTLSKNRKEAEKMKRAKHGKQTTDYGLAMIEKQRARFTYIVNERQFSKYAKAAIAKKGTDSAQAMFETLETRLDNVVYRMGLASTRLFSRQMVGHGHITVNGKKVTIPSYKVSIGDVIGIREGSKKSKMFENLAEKLKDRSVPTWIKFDLAKIEGKIESKPRLAGSDTLFNLNSVLEFYTR